MSDQLATLVRGPDLPLAARFRPAELGDTNGNALPAGGGFLALTEPWPGMLRTIRGDDGRYREAYWSRFPGRYFAGNGARIDDDGHWWIPT